MNLSVGAGHAREIKRRVYLKKWPFPVGAGHAREWKGGIVFLPAMTVSFCGQCPPYIPQ